MTINDKAPVSQSAEQEVQTVRSFGHISDTMIPSEAALADLTIVREAADAAIAALLAELDTPSEEMVRLAIRTWDNKAVASDEAGMTAAIQAIAQHLREKPHA